MEDVTGCECGLEDDSVVLDVCFFIDVYVIFFCDVDVFFFFDVDVDRLDDDTVWKNRPPY